MQCVVNNLLVQYEVSGTGETVLLLHGWGSRLQSYAALSERLSRHYKVVSVDLPGMGGSQPPQSAWNLDDYAQFVSQFLQKTQGTTNVYAAIGHSNGGAIAITAIACNYIQLDKLILLASSGVRAQQSQTVRRGVLKAATKTGKFLSAPLSKQSKRKLQEKLYSSIGSDALLSDEMRATFVRIIEDDVRERARHVQTPTLLIYGDQDKDTPISLGRDLASNIPHHQFVEVAEAGHYVFLDQPTRVHHIVEDFLKV